MDCTKLLCGLIFVFTNVFGKNLNHVFYKDVVIDSGPVRGFLAKDGGYFAFLGIPYAAAPVGGLRFKAPVPPPTWSELFIANRTVICPQQGLGDEDCLILNVFTPTTIFDEPLPVLLYIHGGSFLLGSGQTKGAELLTQQNIILVTINYRLGALGFLCLGTEEAPGNAGLKDQVAALKWVQRNVDKFGGDPSRVTIYGMSAGAASAEMLVLSEMAKNLFHGAIIESGTASAVWSVDHSPIATAQNFTALHTNQSLDSDQLIAFYQNEPAKKLSEMNYEYYQNLTDGRFGFVPCIENEILGIDPFLLRSPRNIMKSGTYNRVPLLYIFASLEGLYLRSSDYYELDYKHRMNVKFENFIPSDLDFKTTEIRDAVTENVRRFYFGNKPVDESTLEQYFNYFGDHLVLHGLLNSAADHASSGDSVYLMEFAYKGNLGSYDMFFENIDKAGHGDAVKYAILNRQVENDDDTLIARRMTEIVVNFMINGNPIPEPSDLLPVTWPAVLPGSVKYLQLDKRLQVLQQPFWERKLFWDNLYEKYGSRVEPIDSNTFH